MRRLAVIGCGAIAESFHLPALQAQQFEDVAVVLVDPDEGRARDLAGKFGIREQVRSHREVMGELDGAIICTPHHLHVPIARDLVEAGVAVLSEKPLGTNSGEVQELRDQARKQGVVVAVNHTRRFIPACRRIKELLEAEALGEILEIRMAEGDRFGWPAATPAMFGRRSGGKGVLLDIGVHALDLAVWWFGSGIEVERYRDDSFGGSEASVHAHLRVGGASFELRLSWLAKQANRYVIRGEKATLEWEIYDLDRIRLRRSDGSSPTVHRIPGAPGGFADLAPRVLDDFLQALDGRRPPSTTPDDALASMELLEGCYAARERFQLPWHDFHLEGTHVG